MQSSLLTDPYAIHMFLMPLAITTRCARAPIPSTCSVGLSISYIFFVVHLYTVCRFEIPLALLSR